MHAQWAANGHARKLHSPKFLQKNTIFIIDFKEVVLSFYYTQFQIPSR